MFYQEVTTPPLQIVIGLGYSMVTDTVLEREVSILIHEASFEIITIGASKELKDYPVCGVELLKIARELSDGYTKSTLGRPVYCIVINQAFYFAGNSSAPKQHRRHIVEVMSVLEETRSLRSGCILNTLHMQRSVCDPMYRERGTEEAVRNIVRFIMSRQQALRKRLPIFKRE